MPPAIAAISSSPQHRPQHDDMSSATANSSITEMSASSAVNVPHLLISGFQTGGGWGLGDEFARLPPAEEQARRQKRVYKVAAVPKNATSSAICAISMPTPQMRESAGLPHCVASIQDEGCHNSKNNASKQHCADDAYAGDGVGGNEREPRCLVSPASASGPSLLPIPVTSTTSPSSRRTLPMAPPLSHSLVQVGAVPKVTTSAATRVPEYTSSDAKAAAAAAAIAANTITVLTSSEADAAVQGSSYVHDGATQPRVPEVVYRSQPEDDDNTFIDHGSGMYGGGGSRRPCSSTYSFDISTSRAMGSMNDYMYNHSLRHVNQTKNVNPSTQIDQLPASRSALTEWYYTNSRLITSTPASMDSNNKNNTTATNNTNSSSTDIIASASASAGRVESVNSSDTYHGATSSLAVESWVMREDSGGRVRGGGVHGRVSDGIGVHDSAEMLAMNAQSRSHNKISNTAPTSTNYGDANVYRDSNKSSSSRTLNCFAGESAAAAAAADTVCGAHTLRDSAGKAPHDSSSSRADDANYSGIMSHAHADLAGAHVVDSQLNRRKERGNVLVTSPRSVVPAHASSWTVSTTRTGVSIPSVAGASLAANGTSCAGVMSAHERYSSPTHMVGAGEGVGALTRFDYTTACSSTRNTENHTSSNNNNSTDVNVGTRLLDGANARAVKCTAEKWAEPGYSQSLNRAVAGHMQTHLPDPAALTIATAPVAASHISPNGVQNNTNNANNSSMSYHRDESNHIDCNRTTNNVSCSVPDVSGNMHVPITPSHTAAPQRTSRMGSVDDAAQTTRYCPPRLVSLVSMQETMHDMVIGPDGSTLWAAIGNDPLVMMELNGVELSVSRAIGTVCQVFSLALVHTPASKQRTFRSMPAKASNKPHSSKRNKDRDTSPLRSKQSNSNTDRRRSAAAATAAKSVGGGKARKTGRWCRVEATSPAESPTLSRSVSKLERSSSTRQYTNLTHATSRARGAEQSLTLGVGEDKVNTTAVNSGVERDAMGADRSAVAAHPHQSAASSSWVEQSSADSYTLWCGMAHGVINIIDPQQGSCEGSIVNAHTDTIVRIWALENGTIWTTGRDKAVKVWDPQTRRKIKTRNIAAILNDVCYVHHTQQVWASANDSILRVYDAGGDNVCVPVSATRAPSENMLRMRGDVTMLHYHPVTRCVWVCMTRGTALMDASQYEVVHQLNATLTALMFTAEHVLVTGHGELLGSEVVDCVAVLQLGTPALTWTSAQAVASPSRCVAPPTLLFEGETMAHVVSAMGMKRFGAGPLAVVAQDDPYSKKKTLSVFAFAESRATGEGDERNEELATTTPSFAVPDATAMAGRSPSQFVPLWQSYSPHPHPVPPKAIPAAHVTTAAMTAPQHQLTMARQRSSRTAMPHSHCMNNNTSDTANNTCDHNHDRADATVPHTNTDKDKGLDEITKDGTTNTTWYNRNGRMSRDNAGAAGGDGRTMLIHRHATATGSGPADHRADQESAHVAAVDRDSGATAQTTTLSESMNSTLQLLARNAQEMRTMLASVRRTDAPLADFAKLHHTLTRWVLESTEELPGVDATTRTAIDRQYSTSEGRAMAVALTRLMRKASSVHSSNTSAAAAAAGASLADTLATANADVSRTEGQQRHAREAVVAARRWLSPTQLMVTRVATTTTAPVPRDTAASEQSAPQKESRQAADTTNSHHQHSDTANTSGDEKCNADAESTKHAANNNNSGAAAVAQLSQLWRAERHVHRRQLRALERHNRHLMDSHAALLQGLTRVQQSVQTRLDLFDRCRCSSPHTVADERRKQHEHEQQEQHRQNDADDGSHVEESRASGVAVAHGSHATNAQCDGGSLIHSFSPSAAVAMNAKTPHTAQEQRRTRKTCMSGLTLSSSSRAIHRAVDELLHNIARLLRANATRAGSEKSEVGDSLTQDTRTTPTPLPTTSNTTHTTTATATNTTSMTPTTRTCSSVQLLSVLHSSSPMRLSGHNDEQLSVGADAEAGEYAIDSQSMHAVVDDCGEDDRSPFHDPFCLSPHR